MTRIVVTVPIASMLSANGRGATWHARAAKTSDLRNLGFLAARLVVPPVGHLMQRAHLTVYIAAPTARRRDAANLHPTVKALLDGMVAYGVLPDDSDAYLVGPDLRPDTERSAPGSAISGESSASARKNASFRAFSRPPKPRQSTPLHIAHSKWIP